MVSGRERQLEEHRKRPGRPILRDREDRLFETVWRFEENLQVDVAANEVYEHWRATARDTMGRLLKGNSKPFVAPELPDGTINLADPDSQGDAHSGHAAAAGLQRSDQRSTTSRSSWPPRSPSTPRTSDTSNRCSTPRFSSSTRHGVTEQPEAVIG